ncbi:MAG: ATP-dependent RNA helicase HrpA [Kiritimatiellae bacterium]|jgi:ATP-dependent helicase HrpA|nr:ATP-dependent RNA helicase HrpA [Kiritimatiellia bacterium]
MTEAEENSGRNAAEAPETTSVLPIVAHKAEIVAAIRDHQVVVICGETGSGKTTQIPQICLQMGRGRHGLVACTQPRRIAAVTVAERVAQEMGPLGGLVGWQHRFARNTTRDNKIKFMTDGILLAEIRDNPMLPQYDTIMVDEAHERTLNIDFILGCLRKILPRRRDLKVIVSSATLETRRFSDFFGGAPVVTIPGRTFPVEVRHRELDEDADLAQSVADAALDALAEQPEGDLLVFLPGERDIRAASDVLRERVPDGALVIPLMASLPPAEQRRAFQTVPGRRRIVVSTNVAETSVTIPGIRCVIDSGLARISRYNARAHVKRLHIETISQASAEQRKGRCGRIGPGLCIRLYSEEDLKRRPEYTEPEIRRTSLAGLILSMLDWRLGDIDDFPFVQPPASAMVREGCKELLELGAIAENPPRRDGSPPATRHGITALGRQIVRFPLEPRLARMLLAAERERCMRDALVVVSALACEDPLVRPADKLDESAKLHAKFKTEKSDFAGIILLWRFFHDASKPLSRSAARRRCLDHCVSYRRLVEWEDVRNQLEAQLRAEGIDTQSQSDSDAPLHKALLAGMLSGIGTWDPDAREYKGANGVRFSIFPGSGLYKTTPQWVMSAELVDTSRLYARRVAVIDPAWIEPIARHVCRYNFHGEYWDPKFGTARALRTVVLHGLVVSEGVRADISRIEPETARAIFIRHGLVEGEFPKPVPGVVKDNLDFMGRRMAASHKTRSANPEYDLEMFIARYAKILPRDCVNVPALRNWLAHAPHTETDALRFTDADFETPPDDGAGFPDQAEIAGRRLPLVYRHNLRAEDDGITCTVRVPDIPLLRLWLSDWLVPGALQDKVVAMLNMLTNAEVAAIAKALGGDLRARDVPGIAARCLEDMDPHVPLSVSLARTLSRKTRIGYAPSLWDETRMPSHLRIRWRVVDERKQEAFVSRSKPEVFEFHRELVSLAPAIADSRVAPTFGKTGFREMRGIRTIDFPDIPEEIQIGHAGAPLIAYPALCDDGDAVSLRLFPVRETATAAHRGGVLKLVALVEGPHLRRGGGVRTLPSRTKPAPIRKGLDSLGEAFAAAPAARPGSRLPAQPDLAADLLRGALQAVFAVGPALLPRTAAALAHHVAARSPHFAGIHDALTKLVSAILASAEDCLRELDHARKLPEESAADIAEQIGWLVFPGFAREVPYKRLLEYPRYLEAVRVRIERGNLDPAKERRKFESVRPIWARHTAFAKAAAEAPPHNANALEEHRWMIEELRVSVWAQELRTPTPVSPQRLDKLWEAAQTFG